MSELLHASLAAAFEEMGFTSESSLANATYDDVVSVVHRALADDRLAGSLASVDPQAALLLDMAVSGQAGMMAAAIRAGAPADVTNTHGLTPLMLAAQNGRTECVKVLIDADAQLDAAAADGSTALHKACDAAFEEICVLLIDAGAPCDAVDTRGVRPFEHLRNRTGGALSASYTIGSAEAVLVRARAEMAERLTIYAAGRMPSALALEQAS